MIRGVESVLRYFAHAHPEEVARRLEGLDAREAGAVLESMPSEESARVLARLNPSLGALMLGRLRLETAGAILGKVSPRIAAGILLPMDPDQRENLFAALPEGSAKRLRQQMAYAPETAGAMMTPQVLSLSIDLTAQGAISVLRRAPEETIYYLYVTDRDGKLAGVLSMRRLLLAGPREPIEGLLHRDVVTIPAHLDREEVAQIMDQRGFMALPVVGADGRLLGVVSHEQALNTVREEAFEDLQRMSGAGGDERALSPLPVVLRKRLPWLTLNLASAFLAAAVVGVFEGIIRQVIALAVLMPVVSAVSGNAGIQALSVVMRGLALREIAPGNRGRVVLKEVRSGLCSGIWIAILAGAVAWTWFGVPALGVVIGAAMVLNLAAASFLGATIPLALRALGRDPAQSSSIFLTTMTDVIGLGSFLGLATLMLHYLD